MSSDAQKQRKMRWWIPLLLMVAGGGHVVTLFVGEDTNRQFISVGLALVLGFVALPLWYILLTQQPASRVGRLLGGWGLSLVFLVGALLFTTRWEGSLSGGAVPRLGWRWAQKPDEKLHELTGSGGEPVRQAKNLYLDFPQFLGPKRNGVLEISLDPDWETHPPEELWRREIGAGWSGFSVVNFRAVTQEQRGGKELVSCYDLVTGEPLWVVEEEVRFKEVMGGDGPRANPAIVKGRVYALGATGILNCIDLVSGQRIWRRSVLEERGSENLLYGKASSPLVEGELVIVTGGKKPGPTLLAYDRMGGEPVWAAGKDSASYASPVVMELDGCRQVVCVNHNTVTGHEIVSGKILWTWNWPATRPKSAQAQQVGPEEILVTASYGMGAAVLQVTQEADGFKARASWKKKVMKTKFSNVCLKDGYAYGLSEARLACVSLVSGERLWRGDYYGYGQNLLVGDHLLVQAEPGHVSLLEVNRDGFRELGRLEALSDTTWNNPSLAGEYLLLRNDRQAVCYRLRLK